MKRAKTGFITSRPISRSCGGICPCTRWAPGWFQTRAISAAMQPTIHQSTIPDPVAAISAPIARLAPRYPIEPTPRAWA